MIVCMKAGTRTQGLARMHVALALRAGRRDEFKDKNREK